MPKSEYENNKADNTILRLWTAPSIVEATVAKLLTICAWNLHCCKTNIAEIVIGEQPIIKHEKR